MTTHTEQLFCLMYPNGQLVGFDVASGGYPFATDSIKSAETGTKEWIQERNSRGEFILCECSVSIKPLSPLIPRPKVTDRVHFTYDGNPQHGIVTELIFIGDRAACVTDRKQLVYFDEITAVVSKDAQ